MKLSKRDRLSLSSFTSATRRFEAIKKRRVPLKQKLRYWCPTHSLDYMDFYQAYEGKQVCDYCKKDIDEEHEKFSKEMLEIYKKEMHL
jgi:hypothetical protein